MTFVSRTPPAGRIVLAGLSVGLILTLAACFGGEDDADGPTTDTGSSGNTVVTLAPPPPPVTATTAAIQQPPPPPPVTAEPPPPPPPTPQADPNIAGQLIYTIESGDTLYSIARQFGVSVDALIELNNITNPDVIRAGDELFIPPAE